MDIISTIDLAGLLDICVCRERLFDKAAHLLFVVGVPLDSFYDQAVRGAARLLCQGTETGTQFWW